MEDPTSSFPVPELVRSAQKVAQQLGFADSSQASVGHLLRVLAASTSGPILEVGTGTGVGTAWLLAGRATDVPLVTVELDDVRADAARSLFATHPNVTVATGTFTDVRHLGPFALAFVDIAELKDDGSVLLEAMADGAMIVLDDFTPTSRWPEAWKGTLDTRRAWWFGREDLHTTELLTTDESAVILAVKQR